MKRYIFTLACLLLSIGTWAQNVAKIGETEYATLADAVAAATDGQTITLISDVALSAECKIGATGSINSRKLTIDFGGHTVSSTANKIFTVYDEVTFTNGKIDFIGYGITSWAISSYGDIIIDGIDITDKKNNAGYIVCARANAIVTLKGGTIKSDKPRSLVYVAKDGKFVMEGGNLINNYATNNSNGACVNIVAGGEATIKGGTLTSPNVGLWADGTLNIEGGTFTSDHIVWVNKGTANISGGDFKAGTTAVYLYTATAKANISGGNFEATGSNSDFLLNIYDSVRDGAKFVVTGGTYKGFDPFNNKAEGAGTNFVDEAFVTEIDANGNYILQKAFAAKIGDTKYATLAEAINAATDGVTITLLSNTTENVTIPASKNITLDLKGKTLSGGSVASNGNKAAIVNNGTITIQDSSAEQTGTIKREDDDTGLSASKSYYVIDNQGTMTIKSGTITNNAGLTTSHKGSSLIRNGEVAEGAVLNIEGGTLTQDNFDVIKNGGNNSVLNITGGTIKSANSYAVLSYDKVNMSAGTVTGKVCLRSYDSDYAVANITGGTINGNITVETYPGNTPTTLSECNISGDAVINGTLSVGEGNGNTFTANDEKGTIAVSGGTFANPVPEKYCADGYIPTANNDGKYGVKLGSYVAQIGDIKYESLSEAIAAATDGEASTITLLTDVIENITIPAGKNITLDLNGKTLNGKQTANTPTIKNLGTLTVKNGNVRRSGDGSASYYVIENEGTITMDEGLNVEGSASSSLIRNNAATAQMTFNAGTYTQTGAFIVVKNDLGNVVINGGTFSTAESKNVLNNWDQMTINGGTFTGNIFNGAYDTDNNKLTINNGTFNTSQIRTYLGNGKTSCPIEIKGGTFTNAQMKYVGTDNKESDTDVQVAVSGGTFANPVPEKYCASGFIPKDNADGTYGVKEGSYIARIGEQGYETLTAAITAAEGETTTITLLADAESTIDLPSNVTIDAKTFTVTLPTFTVIDGEPAVYPNIIVAEGSSRSFRVKKATYTRSGVPAWGTICLPFDLKSKAGIQYYTFSEIDGSSLKVNETTTVSAGVPAIYNKNTAGDLIIVEEDVVIVSLTKQPAEDSTNKLVGTYVEQKIVDNLSSIYYINGDKFHQAKVSLTVPAYRAYINNTTVGGAKPRTLSIVVNGTENTTDIKTVKTTTTTPKANKTVNSTSEEQLDIVEVYDATGRKIPSTRKGLNLVKLSNGKVVKLFVK